MKIDFWKPTISSGQIKATIHQSGNLGFSSMAVQKLKINENGYVKIGTNSEDARDSNLYMVITNKDDDNALKVNKAGNYYYLNTKSFFNENGIDYIRKKIIYDIVELNIDSNIIYKFIKRELARKSKK